MTTITRQQLRDAIEAGIAAAPRSWGFTAEHAEALRKVASEATVTTRGLFGRPGLPRCPVVQAFPDEYSGFAWAWMTDGGFSTVYDEALAALDVPIGPVRVTDDNTTEGEA